MPEEIGHYYRDSYYYINSDPILIDKQEYRAKKWAFKTLIPPSKILELANSGINSISEMAEKLDVTEDLLSMAYTYYKNNNYI